MKTYFSILYFNTGIHERINVGLVMFNKNQCFVDIKESKMEFVCQFKPNAYQLFRHAVFSFKEFYSDKKNMPFLESMTRLSNYNNGIFKIDTPKQIAVDLTEESFLKFFEKRI